MKSLRLPDSLTKIGQYAFEGCGMKTIDIPKSVQNIGDGAFSVLEKTNGCIFCDEQGMVVGHLGGIHAVLAVVLTARQEFHFFSIFRMILQILEEFGKGGKYIIRDIAA